MTPVDLAERAPHNSAVAAVLYLSIGSLALVSACWAYAQILASPPRGGLAPLAACAVVLTMALAECSIAAGLAAVGGLP